MSFLTGLLSKFGTYFLEKMLMLWVNKVIQKYNDYLKKKEQQRIDQANLEKLNEAIKEGKSDEEISNASENFLNGNKP